MMHTWFECKIRYEKIMENGKEKKITETYLVDALSFTEAEARIIEEMTPFISGEFTVTDIKRANYSELFSSDEVSADRWFKCKLVFITLDEKSGAEKKTATHMLVQAADLRDAVKKLDEGMKGTMADYQIAAITETPVVDVFPFIAANNPQPEFPPTEQSRSRALNMLLSACSEGTKTTLTVAGKQVTIDKTGKNTVVTPMKDRKDEENDLRRNATDAEADGGHSTC